MSRFSSRIRPHVQAELDAARLAERRGHFHTAFQHLERAHILGQAATREHMRVHGLMLSFALRHRRSGEALGQAWRLVAAALFTALGLVPEGNTGGAGVSAFHRMPIDAALRRLIDSARA